MLKPATYLYDSLFLRNLGLTATHGWYNRPSPNPPVWSIFEPLNPSTQWVTFGDASVAAYLSMWLPGSTGQPWPLPVQTHLFNLEGGAIKINQAYCDLQLL